MLVYTTSTPSTAMAALLKGGEGKPTSNWPTSSATLISTSSRRAGHGAIGANA